jgi:hypothetical protein
MSMKERTLLAIPPEGVAVSHRPQLAFVLPHMDPTEPDMKLAHRSHPANLRRYLAAISTKRRSTGRASMRALLLCLLLPFSMAAHADDKSAIVGTWNLVSVVYEDQGTKERTPVYGEHPRGIQIATAEGRWIALMTGQGRPVPRTDAERADAMRTMIAYTGRYRVKDGKVITKVEAAWNEAWVGGEQVRAIRFEGDRLFIESPPMPHPNLNDKIVRVIVIWEREK